MLTREQWERVNELHGKAGEAMDRALMYLELDDVERFGHWQREARQRIRLISVLVGRWEGEQ